MASSKNIQHPIRVSIIVPVYNVQDYVKRCFASIAAQTYTDIECIFVDDCGSDESVQIVEKCTQEYQGPIDFKILHHTHNRGLSAARNTGMDAATGEYVYFLDSDDLITPDCIELLVKPLAEKQVDYVVGNYASGGDRCCFLPIKLPTGFLEGQDAIRAAYLDKAWPLMAWNCLINLDFIRRERHRFAEGLVHEDNLWTFQLACTMNSMCVVPQITYIYCMRGNSIITTPSRKKLDSLIRIADEVEKFVGERQFTPDKKFCRFLVNWRESLYWEAHPYGRKIKWEIYKTAVRKHPFSRVKFKLLTKGAQMFYLHHLLPASLGFVYIPLLAKIFAIWHFFLRRLGLR